MPGSVGVDEKKKRGTPKAHDKPRLRSSGSRTPCEHTVQFYCGCSTQHAESFAPARCCLVFLNCAGSDKAWQLRRLGFFLNGSTCTVARPDTIRTRAKKWPVWGDAILSRLSFSERKILEHRWSPSSARNTTKLVFKLLRNDGLVREFSLRSRPFF